MQAINGIRLGFINAENLIESRHLQGIAHTIGWLRQSQIALCPPGSFQRGYHLPEAIMAHTVDALQIQHQEATAAINFVFQEGPQLFGADAGPRGRPLR